MAPEDTSSGTEADAGAFEQERGAGLVPVICGAPAYNGRLASTGGAAHQRECWCVRPLRHDGDHACTHGAS
jgi:hypothetical protein